MKNIIIYAFVLLATSAMLSAASIKVTGKVFRGDSKEGIANITISILDASISTISNKNGDYVLYLTNAGKYNVSLSQASDNGGQKTMNAQIDVSEGGQNIFNFNFNWKNIKLDPVMVYGASRRAEKITESPAAVTVVFADELERKARTGQLANALAGNVGVDVLRNGANDFIVNTRGFNSGLNRRILVLQDGRDVAMPLLGALEWNSFALPQEDFERIELVRGPSASLYGANAFNGVLIMKSFAPKDVIGTKVSLLGGDYSTMKADIRHAGAINEFSYKINFGYSTMDNLLSRRDSTQFLEYPGLPTEKHILTEDDQNAFSQYGTVRLDYDLPNNSSITSEIGYSRSGNEAYVFGLGRTFVKDAERPFVRLAYNSSNINFHAHYMSRYTPEPMWLLVPDAPLRDNSKDIMFDLQHNFVLGNSINIISGITEQLQYIETYGTSIPNKVEANFTGVYTQVEWNIRNDFKLVSSLRYDYASIHPSYISPRVSAVYSPTENHQLRLSLNKAFQRPNYSELYRLTPDAPAFSPTSGAPMNFTALSNSIADSIAVLSGSRPDLNLNLNAMRAKAVGNKDLEVEKILSYELGYKGTFGNSLFLSVDMFYNQLNDFITNFLPGVNTNIEKWTPNLPDSLSNYSNLIKNMVLSSLSERDALRLSEFNGEPTFVVSNANVGKVDEYGVEIELVYVPIEHLTIKTGYSYFGYKVVENKSSQDLLPNTSPHRINLAANYVVKNQYDAGISLQYSDSFDWLAGAFNGQVPAYTIVNINAGVNLMDNLSLGANVFNLFNKKHYQIFGGTYLPRMASLRLSYQLD